MGEKEPFFTLETATLSDLHELGELDRVCFPLDAWPLIERIGALILPATVHTKALYNEKIIGFAGGDIRKRAGLGWITTIAVLPQYRRMGVAETLLENCETEMAMPKVRLVVRKSNTAAQMLYLKHGYLKVETWRHYYQGGEDAVLMEKVLDLSAM